MPIEWSPESQYSKEMKKWDLPKSKGGHNADGFERFPQMLYKAQEDPMDHRFKVSLAKDYVSLDKTLILLSAESFNATCQRTVNDEREYRQAYAEGWRETQAGAMELHEGREQEKAVEAAVRAHQDRNMSEKAKAEIADVESHTKEHVLDVPEARKRRKAKAERRVAA